MTNDNLTKWEDFFENEEKTRAYFLGIIAIIVAIIGIGIASFLSIRAFNHRYDAEAKGAGKIRYEFNSRTNQSVGTFSVSAGRLEYGFFQESGKKNTNYQIEYKKNNSSKFIYVKYVLVSENNDYNGSYFLIKNSYSQRFDIKVIRYNNKNSNAVFEFDWGIS